jgi:hypothetical protein
MNEAVNEPDYPDDLNLLSEQFGVLKLLSGGIGYT